MSLHEAMLAESKIEIDIAELEKYAREVFSKKDVPESPGFFSLVAKKFNDPGLLPPYNISLISLALDKLNFKNKKEILFMAFAILLNFANTAEAKTPEQNKQIEWALEMLDKIDPVEYVLNKKNKNEAASPTHEFTPTDKVIMTWNLYHEIRSGLKVNQGLGVLGVMHSVFERMKSEKFPGTPAGVIFQNFQYSWTLEITKNLNDKTTDMTCYFKLRELVEEYTNGNFAQASERLTGHLQMSLLAQGKNLPKSLTHYHAIGLLNDPKMKSIVKDPNTRNRILMAEKLLDERSPLVVTFDNIHVQYNADTIDALVKQEQLKK